MPQPNKKRKNKDQNKLKEIMSCMMIWLIKNIFKDNKNKDKWSEELPKHSSQDKT
jgi:hypothetical protein